jgi:transcription elongation GreA/GreB family factor
MDSLLAHEEARRYNFSDTLEDRLAPNSEEPKSIGNGSLVTIQEYDPTTKQLVPNTEESYTLAYTNTQGVVNAGQLNIESPLGQTLLGREKGDIVDITGPDETWHAQIIEVF